MAVPEAPAQDFIELTEHIDRLIGRDLIVSDHGTTYRGPITEIRVTPTNQLHITVAWQAKHVTTTTPDTWRLTHNTARDYWAELGTTTVRFDKDDTVHLIVLRSWIGKILPADEAPLEKPAA